MSLEERINSGIKTSMLAKDKTALDALWAVKAAILLLKTEKNAAPINEEAEIKLLQKLVKQRKEAADIYQAQNREDLAKDELAQMEVIAQFLPVQLTEEEITVSIQQMIKEQNISGIKEMGKLMGIASKSFAGKADNKLVSDIVKRLLS